MNKYENLSKSVFSSVGGETIVRALLIPYWSRINAASDADNQDCVFPLGSTGEDIVMIIINRLNAIASLEGMEIEVDPDINSLDKFIWELETLICDIEDIQYLRVLNGDGDDEISQ